jgi:hypothetical protein
MEPSEHLQKVAIPLLRRVRSSGLSALSPAEKIVYLVWCFVADVNNGGSSAFFYNSSGEYADETVAALRAVGSGDIADGLERIVALFPNSLVPTDIDDRNRAWESLPQRKTSTMVEAADSAFFKVGSEELFRQTWEYWQREGRSPT